MNKLPTEIVDLILEYQGYHTWRNGKYICRLQLDDTYDAVKRMPIINLRKGLVNPSNNTFNVSFTKIKQELLLLKMILYLHYKLLLLCLPFQLVFGYLP